jgi:hypothetical protein
MPVHENSSLPEEKCLIILVTDRLAIQELKKERGLHFLKLGDLDIEDVCARCSRYKE